MFEKLKAKNFDVQSFHHAEAILKHDMPRAIDDIESVLSEISLPVQELIEGGGGETELTQRIRRALSDGLEWKEHSFAISRIVDGNQTPSSSHEIDHVKKFGEYCVALEIEWNNKDTFFDRDLENFKRLHTEGVISIGVIITRGESFQDKENLRRVVEAFAKKNGIDSVENLDRYYSPTERQKNLIAKLENKESFAESWARVFVSDKFSESTTHWKKLEDRVKRGVGNPCPLLLIGIPANIIKP